MTALRFSAPSGIVPRTHRRYLQENQAQVADNCRLTSGACDSIRQPATIHTPGVSDIASIFRMTSGGADKWLAWDKDVDVVRGPVAGDTLQRIYWTGDFEPRMSTYADVTGGSGPYPGGSGSKQFVLGVFAPTAAASLSVTGGSAPTTTRSYVYTFVTTLGEESQPSPAVTVTGNANGSWDLSSLQAFPANSFTVTGASWSSGTATYTVSASRGYRVGEEGSVTGVTPSGYNVSGAVTAVTSTTVSFAVASNPGAYSSGGTIARIAEHNTTGMVRRIYRTITATSGETEYRFVADTTSTSYSDTTADAVVAIATLLPSTDWAMPPTDMLGVVAMANNILAGASKNEFCFAEPGRPHAWPSKYRQTAKNCTRIVGLGTYGTTLVGPTDGSPNYISGVEPATMGGGAQALDEAWPCLSKRGIVSASFGVFFPTRAGYALIGAQGPTIATREHYTEEEWRTVYPETFISAMIDNKLLAGYQVDENFSYILVIDKSERASITRVNVKANELWTDPLSGKAYVVQDDDIIKEWDSPAGTKLISDWFSMERVLPSPTNFGAAKIDADFSQSPEEQAAAAAEAAAVLAANQALIDANNAGGAIGEYELGNAELGGNDMADAVDTDIDSLSFQIYYNNVLNFTKEVTDSRPFTLPKGVKGDAVSVRVSGNVKWTSVVIGGNIRELKAA